MIRIRTTIFFLNLLILAGMSSAQVPGAIHYQAILRTGDGDIIGNTGLNIRISILRDSIGGTVAYGEMHSIITSDIGLVNIAIGEGNVLEGNFDSIDWGASCYFMKIEADTSGGRSYVDMGTTQLLAVPYALYAGRTGDTTMWRKSQDGNLYYQQGSIGVGTSQPDTGYMLHVTGNIRSDDAYNINGEAGATDTVNVVTAFDFVNDKLKYRTYRYSGGIIVYISEASSWVDSVGNYILPYVFSCGDTLLDERDGHKYATVQIGSRCWMGQDLNVGVMIPGNADQTDNDTIEKYCYNNDPANCAVYGGLYQGKEAMQYDTIEMVQGICMDGWHIPSDEEWKELEGTIDSQYPVGDPVWDGEGLRGFDAGKNLKATTGWLFSGNGTNLSGFTALPGGFRAADNNFYNIGFFSCYWTSTQFITESFWDRSLYSFNDTVHRFYYSDSLGRSVRCVRY